MRIRDSGCVAVLAVLAPLQAFGWGANGHRVVGEIAARHLSPWAAREIAVLLDGQSLAEVANWPDDIKSDPRWGHAETWHYISIDDDRTIETAPRDPQGDVLEALHRFEAVLRSPAATRQQRAEALKFLVHFAGDVHQPLHVGRVADRGGNQILVTWMGQQRNLHQVWDEGLIESLHLSFSELADFLDDPTPAQVADWQAAPYEEWVRESKAVRPLVYEIGDGRLSWGYRFRALPVVERRLLQAGVRLAGRLDSLFAPAAPPDAWPPPAFGPLGGSPGPAAPAGDARAELFEADRAFFAATRDRGLDGWLDALSEDAVRMPRVGSDAVRGGEAIRALDAALFADPAVRLRWEPTDAGVFADGRHGFTTGRYEVVRVGEAGEGVEGSGHYVTWWRRAADGSWEVILDTGAPDSPGAAPEG